MSYLSWSKPEEETRTKQEVDQSSVGANVAATTEATEPQSEDSHDKEPKDSLKESPDKKSRGSGLSLTWSGRRTKGGRNDAKPSEIETRESVGDVTTVEDDDSNSSGLVRFEADPTETTAGDKSELASTHVSTEADGVDRLKAALDDDARRASQMTNASGSSEQSRRSVESLLKRAQRFFDAGRFGEARTAAEAAQSLGEKSQLEFAPDQERPSDLVQRIDDHERALSEQSTADDPKPSEQASSGKTQLTVNDLREAPSGSQSTSAKSDSTMAKADPAGSSSAKNGASGRSWLWRDRSGSMNPFRRERTDDRKSIAAQTPSTVTSVSHVELGLEVEKPIEEPSTDLAVVQANQGADVDAGTFAEESSRELTESTLDKNADHRTLRFSRESHDDEATTEDSTGVRQGHRKRLAGLFDETVAASDESPLSEDASQPPVIDELEPAPARRVVHRRSLSAQKVEEPTAPEGDLTANFVIATLALAVCSYFALVCYRRGAT